MCLATSPPEVDRAISDCYPALKHFVRQRVSDREDAAEIAQQAIVEALTNISSFRSESSFKTWIFGIARNLTLNHINRSPRRRHRFESDEVLEDFPSPAPTPSERAEVAQQLALASRAFARMSQDLQQALLLVAVEELDISAAAARLNICVATLKSRVFRARKHLRQSCNPPSARLLPGVGDAVCRVHC